WPPFPALLWFPPGSQYTPERLAELKSLGIDGVHVDGRDSPEAIANGGVSLYTGDAPGKGTPHPGTGAYESARAAARAKHGRVRPPCFNDSQVRSLQLEKLTRALDGHLPFGPLGIALEDEVSVTSGINPVDFCYCEWCLRGLRAHLRRRY